MLEDKLIVTLPVLAEAVIPSPPVKLCTTLLRFTETKCWTSIAVPLGTLVSNVKVVPDTVYESCNWYTPSKYTDNSFSLLAELLNV